MASRSRHLVWLFVMAVIGVTAAHGAATAGSVSDQNGRPQTMNLPIFAADDLEKSVSPQNQFKPQPQYPQQLPRMPAKNPYGRRLQQDRGWGGNNNPNWGGQSWGSQPLRGNGNAFNWGQNQGANAAGRASAATSGGRGNTGGFVSGTAAANSQGQNWGGRKGNPGNGRGNTWRVNRGDRSSLQALTGNTNSWSGMQSQPIIATGNAGTLSQGIRRRGNARAAAQSLAQAYSSGQADAAAQAVASAATVDNDAEATATAEAVATATVDHPKVAPQLLAQSAGLAVSRGQTDKYARTMADAFAYSKRSRNIPQFTSAVADAIATGGAPTRYAYGQAMATAIADGGDSQAAVAEATATAFCQGGSTATAWAQAYAVALSQNSQGCLVLNQAKALAQSKCGSQGTDALANAQATSTVLGFCGIMDILPSDSSYNWGSSTSGSSSNGNK